MYMKGANDFIYLKHKWGCLLFSILGDDFMFNPIADIERRIEDLQRVKEGYQKLPQQPINIYNNTNPLVSDFKAQYTNENDKVDEILVNCKTAFINLKNGVLSIKETNGDITTYPIILPKDEKDLRIEELERKLKEYESQPNNAVVEIKQPTSNDTKLSKK